MEPLPTLAYQYACSVTIRYGYLRVVVGRAGINAKMGGWISVCGGWAGKYTGISDIICKSVGAYLDTFVMGIESLSVVPQGTSYNTLVLHIVLIAGGAGAGAYGVGVSVLQHQKLERSGRAAIDAPHGGGIGN